MYVQKIIICCCLHELGCYLKKCNDIVGSPGSTYIICGINSYWPACSVFPEKNKSRIFFYFSGRHWKMTPAKLLHKCFPPCKIE